MSRLVTSSGVTYSVPDDATNDEAAQAIVESIRQPTTMEVVESIPKTAELGIGQQAAGAMTAFSDLLGSPELVKQNIDVAKMYKEDIATSAPKNMSFGQEALQTAGVSALQQAPSLAALAVGGPLLFGAKVAAGMGAGEAGLATGKTLLGLGTSVMGAQTAAGKYADMRAYGFSPLQSVLPSAFHGLVEKYTEYIGLGALVSGSPFKKMLKELAYREIGSEEVATLLQDINDKITTQPDMTLGDYLHDAAITAVSTALQVPVQAGMQHAAIRAVSSIYGPFIKADKLTPEQGAMLKDAAQLAQGIPLDPMNNNMTVEIALQSLTTPKPVIDVQDLELKGLAAGQIRPTPEGALRVYAVVPADQTGTTLPGLITWTSNLSKIQDQIDMMGENVKVAYVNLTPADIRLKEATPEAQAIRTEQQVTATDEYVLPSVYVDSGTYLYTSTPTVVEDPTLQIPGEPLAGTARQTPEPLPSGVTTTTSLEQPTAPAITTASTAPAPSSVVSASGALPLRVGQAAATKIGSLTTIVDSGQVDDKTQKQGKIKIAFVGSPESKEVFLLGKHITSGSASAALVDSVSAWTKTAERVTGLNGQQLSTAAQAYYKEITSRHEGMISGKVDAPTYVNVREDMAKRVAWEARRDGLIKVAEVGKVTLATGVQETPYVMRQKAFLQSWLSRFAPETSVVIEGVAGAGQSARYVQLSSTKSAITLPSEQMTKMQALVSTAHEFGHHLLEVVMGRTEHSKALAQIRREYNALKDQIPDMTIEQFVTKWSSARVIQEVQTQVRKMGLTIQSPAMEYIAWRDQLAGQPGYTTSFEEYAAEQFARYVARNSLGFTNEAKTLWKDVVKTTKKFFDEVVSKLTVGKKYEAWVGALPATSVFNEQSIETKSLVAAEKMWFDLAADGMKYTTKIIERLPKKQRINKMTVYQEMSRQDVREQERAIFGDVLNSFDGEVVDRTLLIEAVQQRIVPLKLVETTQWATYGLSSIGVNSLNTDAKTLIFDLPFDVSTANHFSDPKYFGHVRVFFDSKVGGTLYISELQSDLKQKKQQAKPRELSQVEHDVEIWTKIVAKKQTIVDDFPKLVEDLKKHTKFDQTQVSVYFNTPVEKAWYMASEVPDVHDAMLAKFPELAYPVNEGLSIFKPNNITAKHIPELIKLLSGGVGGFKLRLEENKIRLRQFQEELAKMTGAVVAKPETPLKWWDLLLREANLYAAKEGVEKVRLATADTVAKIEEWPKYHYVVQQLANFGEVGGTRWVVVPAGMNINEEYKGQTYKTEEEARAAQTKSPAFTYGRYQGIYNRYATEITKSAKREFGAKEVVDSTNTVPEDTRDNDLFRVSRGNTWLEWTVQPDLQNLSIEYFDVVMNSGIAGDATEKLVQEAVGKDIPDIPTSFARWQGFLQSSLQLNQMAKLLPRVEPLQRFRRLYQGMVNLKNQLMVGPNERIKQWVNLNKKDSLGIMDMLRSEVRDGKHWTQLEKHQVMLAGKPATVFIHKVTERVAQEATKRGLSENAVKTYMGVKNDYLTILGQLEQTILGSLDVYFKNNNIAKQIRAQMVQQQFIKFRESPYISDKRLGQHAVLVKAKKDTQIDGKTIKKGDNVWFSGHRTQKEAQREYTAMARRYNNDNFAVSQEYIEDSIYVMRALPKEFVKSLPEKLGLDASQLEKFEQLYYDTTKEGAYLKLLGYGKKNTPGADQDMRLTYSNYMWGAANLISKMAYSSQMQKAIGDVDRAARAMRKVGGNLVPMQRLHEYMSKSFDYMMRPQHEWEQLRAMVSLWYLYGVPKTAFMNLSTIVTTTYPRLAAIASERFGAVKGDAIAVSAMLTAIKDTAQYWKDATKLSLEKLQVLSQAKMDGVTNQSYAAELAAMQEPSAMERLIPNVGFLKDSGLQDRTRAYIWQTMHWGMLPFRAVEEFNRQVTLLAAYDIAKRAEGLPDITTGAIKEGSAYLSARDTVDYTQNDYNPGNRPAFLRGKKSVALIFFSFTQNMTFFMFGGDKGWLRGWLVLAALAGWQGLPGMENVIDLLNWLGRKVFDEPIDLRLEARDLAKGIGLNPDLAAHGLTHSMFGLGWDVSSSMGMGRIIPGTDAVFGQGRFEQRFMQMAGEVTGPFGSLTLSLMQALVDDNPNALMRWDRALPPMIRNIERAYNAQDTGEWQDRKGAALVDEASGLEILGQLAGFAPTTKTQEQEKLRFQRDQAEFYTLARQNLLSAYYQAYSQKNFEAMGDIKQKIMNWNQKVPDRQLQITAKELQQSIKARARSEAATERGISPIKRYLPLYERIADQFPEQL